MLNKMIQRQKQILIKCWFREKQ